jgi:hypothetical protein
LSAAAIWLAEQLRHYGTHIQEEEKRFLGILLGKEYKANEKCSRRLRQLPQNRDSAMHMATAATLVDHIRFSPLDDVFVPIAICMMQTHPQEWDTIGSTLAYFGKRFHIPAGLPPSAAADGCAADDATTIVSSDTCWSHDSPLAKPVESAKTTRVMQHLTACHQAAGFVKYVLSQLRLSHLDRGGLQDVCAVSSHLCAARPWFFDEEANRAVCDAFLRVASQLHDVNADILQQLVARFGCFILHVRAEGDRADETTTLSRYARRRIRQLCDDKQWRDRLIAAIMVASVEAVQTVHGSIAHLRPGGALTDITPILQTALDRQEEEMHALTKRLEALKLQVFCMTAFLSV